MIDPSQFLIIPALQEKNLCFRIPFVIEQLLLMFESLFFKLKYGGLDFNDLLLLDSEEFLQPLLVLISAGKFYQRSSI